jgi:agmatinase
MRRIVELAPIAEIGIRALSTEEKDFIDKNDIPVLYCSRFLNEPNALDNVLSGLNGHVYLTVDVDVLDPSEMPAVGTPEPGGLSWQMLLNTIRTIAGRFTVVGADIVELCPPQGNSSSAYSAAKLAYKIIGYCVK